MQFNKLNKTLGVIGGGQLGKMIGLAAANLGISCYFYDSDKKFLASGIIAFFRLLYFHNECYNNHSFLLGLIRYMKL